VDGVESDSEYEGLDAIEIQSRWNNTEDVTSWEYTLNTSQGVYHRSGTGGGSGLFSARFAPWSYAGYGGAQIYLTLTRSDGLVQTFCVARLTLLVDPSGFVYDADTKAPVQGATATLQVKTKGAWEDWDAYSYNQANPQITDEKGGYGWFVPEGDYRVLVSKAGYDAYATDKDVKYGVITVLPPRTDIDIYLTKTKSTDGLSPGNQDQNKDQNQDQNQNQDKNPLSIVAATVNSIADQAYKGKQIRPAVTVTLGGQKLTSGTDYTLSYGTNKVIGKGTVVISGKGNYAGLKTVSFRIVPAKTSLSKLTVGKGLVKVTWKKVSAAQKITKYEIRYRAKGTSKWTTKTVAAKNASLTVKKLKKGKTCQFQVRSYKSVGGVKYYSPWSATKTSKKVK
jgi:hypothetical protein